jgi:hypothetical protein
MNGVQSAGLPSPVARIFTPAELDLDGLAEAIRLLLRSSPPGPQGDPSNQPDRNLLSSPCRGTHEVGENEAP